MQNKTKKLIKGSLASALFSPEINLASGPFPLMGRLKMDEWKKIEAEFIEVCNEANALYKQHTEFNSDLQGAELWDLNQITKVSNRGYALQDVAEKLTEIGYRVRLVADKAKKHEESKQ